MSRLKDRGEHESKTDFMPYSFSTHGSIGFAPSLPQALEGNAYAQWGRDLLLA